VPEQLVSPAGHAATHAPETHTCWLVQVFPQAPQFCAEVCVSTQVLLQLVELGRHWHWPAKQAKAPLPQAWPHAPQLFTSKLMLMQDPLQLVCAGPQLATQLPKRQTWLAVHVRPQAPQLLGSVLVVTQVPLHRVVPARQVQAPLTHWPVPQLFPHVPQLDGSLSGLMHRPLQVR
jgi:hypothetical protein